MFSSWLCLTARFLGVTWIFGLDRPAPSAQVEDARQHGFAFIAHGSDFRQIVRVRFSAVIFTSFVFDF
jgi:hypothetical protein